MLVRVERENVNNQAEISNNQYYTSTTALQIRLEVEALLKNIELDVRAEQEIYDSEKDVYVKKKISGVDPLFSKEIGIRNYMRFLRSLLNTQVVQGNLDEDSLGDVMQVAHKRLSKDLMLNRYEYGLSKNNYFSAMSVMNTIHLFLTRLLNNEERKSYAATFKHVESSETKLGSGRNMFGLKT